MKTNRKIIIGILIFILLIALCSCTSRSENSDSEKPDIVINDKESFFSDFEVEDGKVMIKCYYVIYNNTDTTYYIQLRGNFEDDQKLGLLKEPQLYARINIEDDDTYLEISPGENKLDVVYVGTFAGTERKTNRLLPDTDIIISGLSEE